MLQPRPARCSRKAELGTSKGPAVRPGGHVACLQRQLPKAKAFAGWSNFLEKFKIGRPVEPPSETKEEAISRELLALLCSRSPDTERVSALVDDLEASAGLPFNEESLGGGPWIVRYTRGRPLLWSLTYGAGRVVNGANRAAQDFDPADRSAVNWVELFGPDAYIAAKGTYEPQGDARTTPVTIRADITSGRLRAWALDLPLPISGSGTFEVLYVDERLRVFRSNGDTYAVQVRADLLPE